MSRPGLACAALAALAACALIACSASETTATSCKDIPSGGCPLEHGVACDDPSCEAAYACTSNGWKFDHPCALRDASVDSASVTDAGPRDAAIDVPGATGGPGCDLLQPPDCPAATALLCPQGCCGCEDLFVCTDGGWNYWGFCADGGAQQK